MRNVRYYQDGGMLPPPRRQGRVALYSDAHLARLRLITRLLERGYTAANITELVGAWEQGRDLSDVLGMERVATGYFGDEIPGFLTASQIHALFATPEVEPGLIDKVVHAGLAAPDGDRFRVPSPRVLHAIAELIKNGAPLGAVLEIGGQLLRGIDETVRGLVSAVAEHVLGDRDKDQSWIPRAGELSDVAKLIKQIKPLASTATTAALGLSLDRHVEAILGDYITRLMPQNASDVALPVSPA